MRVFRDQKISDVPFTVVLTRAFVLFGVAALAGCAALAFRVGSDWEALRYSMERLLARVGYTAAALLALAGLIGWGVWRQRKERQAGTPPANEHPPDAHQ